MTKMLVVAMATEKTDGDIAGVVASLTESELDVLSEELPTTFSVDQENPRRRASGWDV